MPFFLIRQFKCTCNFLFISLLSAHPPFLKHQVLDIPCWCLNKEKTIWVKISIIEDIKMLVACDTPTQFEFVVFKWFRLILKLLVKQKASLSVWRIHRITENCVLWKPDVLAGHNERKANIKWRQQKMRWHLDFNQSKACHLYVRHFHRISGTIMSFFLSFSLLSIAN